MFDTSHPSFLRYVLWADAIASGATGLVMVAGAGLLESLLGLPGALAREAGLILVPYAALVAVVAARAQISRAAVWVFIVANAAWTIGSIGLLPGGLAPTALGYAFVIAQALVVAVLAELQYAGVRSLTPVQAG
jgi:hypothetical protein